MTDATAVLLHALVDNMHAGFGDPVGDWDALSMVIELGDGYFSAYGYAYPADRSVTSVAADPGPTKVAVDAYLAGYFEPGEARPVALLVQLDRTSGRYSVTFEDSDPDRWKVTPRNFDEMPETLRPRFDD